MMQRPLINKIKFLWTQSWRMMWRDWRGGELSILVAGLIIAITSITAVGFFTDRIERGLNQQSAELIGADLVITSGESSVNRYSDEARKQGLITASLQTFRSVLLADGKPQLVEVKSVSDGYPLRGELRISDTAFGDDSATSKIPPRGAVWVEARLLQLLGIGLNDSIRLGKSTFVIEKLLRYEPDRAGDLFSVAPRVLMNTNDLAKTELIGIGSRITYRVLIAGDAEPVGVFRQKVGHTLNRGEQILTLEDGRPELNSALLRAKQFLGLAALISVLLAGVAVATVAHRFTRRHLDTSAMLRCLGSSQNTIIQLFTLEMLWLALIASSIGCVLGALTQTVIAELLDQLVLTNLPPPSFKSIILGYATGIVMLIGFAMPPLLSLRQVPPLRVLRKDIPTASVSMWLLYLVVAICMSLLLYWQIGDMKLVGTILGGIVGTLCALAIAAYGLIKFVNILRGRVGIAARFGVANIARRPASSVIQIVAFGLGIMVLLLLSTVRSDLMDDWQRSLPADAPNHFVINVQPAQVEPIERYFHDMGVKNTRLYPMVRARLTEINGRAVTTADYDSERAKHMITREFNLSWAETMQSDNKLLAGRWWNRDDFGKPLISMEDKLSKTLKMELNDTLGFDINGRLVEFRISNLRSVDWDTFNINFFTVVPPGILDSEPANWVTSVYLSDQQRERLAGLVKQFPNVTLIDVDVVMKRVRLIMDRVALAVEFIFLFTLMAGIAVLYAAIQSNQDERRFENAVLRTLGASRKILLFGLLAEFTLLGSLSGLLAGVSATSLALLLSEVIFKFDYQFDASVILIGIISGTIIVVVAGLLGTYRVLEQPPIQSLREGTV